AKVREAVDYCFSMTEAVEEHVEPAGRRLYYPFPQSIAKEWGFPTERWKKIPHEKNIEKAKQIFEEEGISKDYSWRIIVPPDNKREQIGITVGNGLK
ncbi:MAG: ABC transporter substrate-binding protein, partial [Halobacteriaceae archaeon]